MLCNINNLFMCVCVCAPVSVFVSVSVYLVCVCACVYLFFCVYHIPICINCHLSEWYRAD